MAVDLPESVHPEELHHTPRKPILPPMMYHELEPNEIRLVSFTDATVPNGLGKDKFQGRVEVSTFFTEYAPPYIVLSYASDEENDFIPITVNDDSTLQIPRTVGEALLQIYTLRRMFIDGLQKAVGESYQTPEVYLWIDAFCINQTDNREKSLQIPRMPQIYSKAYTTLIWLGSFADVKINGPAAEILFELLLQPSPRTVFPKIMQFNLTDAATRDAFLSRSDQGLPEVIKQFTRIIQRPWFQRAWTLQEYALSYRRPCVLLGMHLLTLGALHHFGAHWLQKNDNSDSKAWETSRILAETATTWTNIAFGPEPLDDFIRTAFFGELPPANKLLWLMMNYPRKSRVPHDSIYGLLAVLDLDEIPKELEPNYDEPWESVCQKWTCFFIHETKDLRILMSNLPSSATAARTSSWSADFSSLAPTSIIPSTPHNGCFSLDGTTLELEGIHCGTIRRVFGPSSENIEKDFLTFHETMIRESSEIQGVPHTAAWQIFLAYFLGQALGLKRSATQMTALYASANDYLQDLGEEERKWAMGAFQEYTFVLLGNGSVLRILPRRELDERGVAAEEYSVWAFKGATQRYVVRKEAAAERSFYEGWLSEDLAEGAGGFLGLFAQGAVQRVEIA